MRRDKDLARLAELVEAVRKAVQYSHGLRRDELDQDEIRLLALVRLIEVAGEASIQLTTAVRDRHLEIPWQLLRGTRNRLIHGYFAIDLDILWEILHRSLPELLPRLEAVLVKERSRGSS